MGEPEKPLDHVHAGLLDKELDLMTYHEFKKMIFKPRVLLARLSFDRKIARKSLVDTSPR